MRRRERLERKDGEGMRELREKEGAESTSERDKREREREHIQERAEGMSEELA